MKFWVMILPKADWRYVWAEAPCWKGEVNLNLCWFGVVVGWERKSGELRAEGE